MIRIRHHLSQLQLRTTIRHCYKSFLSTQRSLGTNIPSLVSATSQNRGSDIVLTPSEKAILNAFQYVADEAGIGSIRVAGFYSLLLI